MEYLLEYIREGWTHYLVVGWVVAAIFGIGHLIYLTFFEKYVDWRLIRLLSIPAFLAWAIFWPITLFAITMYVFMGVIMGIALTPSWLRNCFSSKRA